MADDTCVKCIICNRNAINPLLTIEQVLTSRGLPNGPQKDELINCLYKVEEAAAEALKHLERMVKGDYKPSRGGYSGVAADRFKLKPTNERTTDERNAHEVGEVDQDQPEPDHDEPDQDEIEIEEGVTRIERGPHGDDVQTTDNPSDQPTPSEGTVNT